MRRANMRNSVLAATGLLLVVAVVSGPARAENPAPYPGTQIIETKHSYGDLVARLDAAVKANRMGLVSRASATTGAASKGVTIPGNMVVGVFRPDFAIRMLEASVPAGIEAPLRFYITESTGGRATLTYRKPSAVFAPYGAPKLDAMARELDAIFAKIAGDAAGE